MKREVKICLALMVVAAAMFFVSFTFPEASIWAAASDDRPYQTGVGTWPRVVCVTMFILCGLLVLNETLFASPRDTQAERLVEQEAAERSLQRDPNLRYHILAFASTFFAYMILLLPLGFAIATILFAIVVVLILPSGSLGKGKCLAISFSVSIIVVVLFCRILYLPLPRGMGIFRELSQAIIF